MKEIFEKSSVLKFTYELGVDNKIPFLDVDVENNGGVFVTSIYKKPTDSGYCLNAQSECSERYKTSVIMSNIQRVYEACSSWDLFHK